MTANDRSILKNLAVSREFEAVRRLADTLMSSWKVEIATGSTEFEYIRSAFERDGKILGVASLIQEIDRV